MTCHSQDSPAQGIEGQHGVAAAGGRRRISNKRLTLVLLAVAVVAVALIAVFMFQVSPITVAVAGFMALHPLLHLAGGHRHGASEMKREDKQGHAQESHTQK